MFVVWFDLHEIDVLQFEEGIVVIDCNDVFIIDIKTVESIVVVR